MKRDVLLLGAGGMLGRAWQELLTSRGQSFRKLDVPELDYQDLDALRALTLSDTDVVINCAAYTDVDGAETDEAVATRINGDAVGGIAEACGRAGATLIHYSTDYVFGGAGSEPYAVDAPRAPGNAYGRSKLRGEELLEQSQARFLLIRTSWLYAPWGKNFVLTIDRAGRDKAELRVVDDQRGRPTSAQHLASASWGLLDAGAAGTFHVCDAGECTWFGLAAEIVRQRGHACRVAPCTSEEYPRPAERPRYSVLDLSRATDVLGAFPPWQENLRAVLAAAPRG